MLGIFAVPTVADFITSAQVWVAGLQADYILLAAVTFGILAIGMFLMGIKRGVTKGVSKLTSGGGRGRRRRR